MRERRLAEMVSVRTTLGVIAACSLAFGTIDAARGATPDVTAKFLAGLVVPAAAAETEVADSVWLSHSIELDRQWSRVEQRQLAKIRNWAPANLGQAYEQTGPMFYMFSGPDFLYANAFYPNATSYLLCGTEPVGNVPELENLPAEALPEVLSNLRKSLESVLNWSFFITKNMKSDLTRTQLSGTLPLLYVFLARGGYTIDSVMTVGLDRNGNFTVERKSQTPGVQIVFHGAAGTAQTLYYFSTDLSDDGIRANPGFMKLCEQQGAGVSLIKAASYLMHENGFSRVRDFLLRQSTTLLQDDSGVPLRLFDRTLWDLQYFGEYVGPIDVFKQYWQLDLADAYSQRNVHPIDFSFGYHWQPSRSTLMIAKRR